MALAVPHRRQKRRIECLQALLIDLQRMLKRRERHEGGHDHFLELELVVGVDVAEILLGVVIDLERREE